MNHEHEQSRTGSTFADFAHSSDDTVEPGQSSRSALLRKPGNATRSGLWPRKARDDRMRIPVPPESPVSDEEGALLPDDVRGNMERSFGADFSAVRVRESAEPESLGADAMTRGRSISFAPGRLDLGSEQGLALLGHELAHVVQQSQGRVAATSQTKGIASNEDPLLEREADELGAGAARGERVADAGGAGAAASGPTQFRSRAFTEAEARQEWDRYDLTGRVTADASEVALGDAMATNRRQGLPNDLIEAIRVQLGLAPRPVQINIDFCRALREAQRARGVLRQDGVVDGETLRAIDMGHSQWGGDRHRVRNAINHYRHAAPWAAMDEAQLAAIRRVIVT